jgi:hypothetical protein
MLPMPHAESRPAPTVAACVAAWNAGHPALASASGTVRRAVVQAVASGSGRMIWNRTTKLDMSGPGCSVEIVQAPGRLLIGFRPWPPTSKSTSWGKLVRFSGSVAARHANANVEADGSLRLR